VRDREAGEAEKRAETARIEARSHFETELELQLERQRTSLGVAVPFSPPTAATDVQITQPTFGQLQPGHMVITPSHARPSALAAPPLVVPTQVESVIDANKYLLPPTSNGRSDPLQQTAATTTTAGFGGPSLMTNCQVRHWDWIRH